jgi:BON domain
MVAVSEQDLVAQPVPAIKREADHSRNVLQMIQARKLLQADPELGPMNIGVIVENRVATLWGPVPAPEFALRAVQCLRPMIDLAEIRNELFVSDDPDLRPSPPLKIEKKPELQPELLPPTLPKEGRLPPGAPGMLTRHEVASNKQKATLPVLGLPRLDEPPSPAVVAVELEADRELAEAVRKVLQSQANYRDVQFAVREGRVYLRAAKEDSDAMHEAARAIAQVPHVVGVVVMQKPPER